MATRIFNFANDGGAIRSRQAQLGIYDFRAANQFARKSQIANRKCLSPPARSAQLARVQACGNYFFRRAPVSGGLRHRAARQRRTAT
jgi:hypothetical protein